MYDDEKPFATIEILVLAGGGFVVSDDVTKRPLAVSLSTGLASAVKYRLIEIREKRAEQRKEWEAEKKAEKAAAKAETKRGMDVVMPSTKTALDKLRKTQ